MVYNMKIKQTLSEWTQYALKLILGSLFHQLWYEAWHTHFYVTPRVLCAPCAIAVITNEPMPVCSHKMAPLWVFFLQKNKTPSPLYGVHRQPRPSPSLLVAKYDPVDIYVFINLICASHRSTVLKYFAILQQHWEGIPWFSFFFYSWEYLSPENIGSNPCMELVEATTELYIHHTGHKPSPIIDIWLHGT